MSSPTGDHDSLDAPRSLPAGVSVVVPCYNSALTIGELVDRVAAVLPTCSESHELILVNDGSQDETWAAISRLATQHSWVVGVELMRNYGQHNATLCGVRMARYDVTVTLDDDLQNPPEEIPRLLEELEHGHDLVYGTPTRQPDSLFRGVASWLIRWSIVLATRQRSVKTISAFRAFRTALRQASSEYRSPQVIIDVLLAWGTSRVSSVRVGHAPRATGRSTYSLLDLCRVALLLWTGYTTAPLRFASWLGFGFLLFGLGVLVYVLGVYVFQGSLPGFTFLASLITLFAGAQLLTLGIIGAYIARLFTRSLDRPSYAIRSWTQSSR